MDNDTLTVAVVADTHVPDRVRLLHPKLLPSLTDLHPDLILHAGDICAPAVLDALRQVAPVVAVRGNRDWLFVKELPHVRKLTLNGVGVILQHGHGSFWDYLVDKWDYVWRGYRFERYARIVRRAAGDAKVLVFGHTHHAECVWEENLLLFNPGSASLPPHSNGTPSFGVLKFGADGSIEGEIRSLEPMQ